MHGTYDIKFVNAQQAELVYNYKDIKQKLHKTNTSIWFNKTCKIEQLTPKYVNVSVNCMYLNLDATDICDSLMRPPEDGTLIAETCVGFTNILCFVNDSCALLDLT